MGRKGLTPGRSRLTEQRYNEIVDFFRANPGATSRAADVLKLDYQTTKRAWHVGWPEPDYARRPIKDILFEEANAKRAVARAQAEATGAEISAQRLKEKELARLDAAAERSREAVAIRGMLSANISQLAVLGTLSGIGVPLAQRIKEDVLAALTAKSVTVKDAMSFLRQLQSLTLDTGTSLKATMEMIRLHLGEPQQILGVARDPSWKADAMLAVQHLGSDLVRQAVVDIFDGKATEHAEALVRWQAEQDTLRQTH